MSRGGIWTDTVTLSPRAVRQERIEELIEEIDRLAIQYAHTYSHTACLAIEMQIQEKQLEINRLNQPHALERESGQRIAYQISAGLVIAGVVFSVYAMVALGALITFVALMTLDGSPSLSPRNRREP